MARIMLDLETMGNNFNAAIIAIGAVAFKKDFTVQDLFYVRVDLQSSIDSGGVMDGSTVMWWLQQNVSARRALTKKSTPEDPVYTIKNALDRFVFWLAANGGVEELWGNGATADNVWLKNAFLRLNMTPPWSYKADRCFRTVKNLAPSVVGPDPTIRHHALDDAVAQVRHLKALYSALGLNSKETLCTGFSPT